MSALRQSSRTGVKRFRALFMTSNPCIRKDPGAEEHGVVRATEHVDGGAPRSGLFPLLLRLGL